MLSVDPPLAGFKGELYAAASAVIECLDLSSGQIPSREASGKIAKLQLSPSPHNQCTFKSIGKFADIAIPRAIEKPCDNLGRQRGKRTAQTLRCFGQQDPGENGDVLLALP
jgi:hypothetical protein